MPSGLTVFLLANELSILFLIPCLEWEQLGGDLEARQSQPNRNKQNHEIVRNGVES